MQKIWKIILGNLKKYSLVNIQIVLILASLFSYLGITSRNGGIVVNRYKIDKVGDVSIYSPTLLLRNSDNQSIDILYRADNSVTQPINVEIAFAFDSPSITIAAKSAHQNTSEITFADMSSGEIIQRSFNIATIGNSENDVSELLVEIKVNGQIAQSAHLTIKVESQTQSFFRNVLPYLIFVLVISLAFTLIYQNYFIRRTETDNNLSRRLEIAENKLDETPDKVKPIWDVARFTLEKYINRNQQQINLIFSLSLSVMIVSFIIIIIGVYIALKYPDSFSIAILTTAVGVITEFIGATFLIVFKSTLQQASDYSKTLERIATIGVAVQILDTLVDDPKTGNMKSKTKSEVVKLLIKNTVIISETDDKEKS